jgi:hypothetical protein
MQFCVSSKKDYLGVVEVTEVGTYVSALINEVLIFRKHFSDKIDNLFFEGEQDEKLIIHIKNQFVMQIDMNSQVESVFYLTPTELPYVLLTSTTIAIVHTTHLICIKDLRDMENVIKKFRVYNNIISDILLSPDRKWMAVMVDTDADDVCKIHYFNYVNQIAGSKKLMAIDNMHFQFSPDGRYLICNSGFKENNWIVINVEANKCILMFTYQHCGPFQLNSDCTLLAHYTNQELVVVDFAAIELKNTFPTTLKISNAMHKNLPKGCIFKQVASTLCYFDGCYLHLADIDYEKLKAFVREKSQAQREVTV